MLDGTLNHCKSCVKARVSQHRKDNIDKVREYDRNRPNHNERIKARSERYKKLRTEGSIEFIERERGRLRKYRAKHPERDSARNAVSNALRDGKLVRPSECSCCGKECKPQGHHWSYEEEHWLDVVWLCTRCHADEHKKLRELGRDID